MACALMSLAGLAAPDRAIAGWCETRIICPSPYQPWVLGCYSNFGTCTSDSTSVFCGRTLYTCEDCETGALLCKRIITET
jgi:hypothetical protein